MQSFDLTPLRARLGLLLVAGAVAVGACASPSAATAPPPVTMAASHEATGEVARLAANRHVREALAHIENHRAQGLRELVELTEVPAPPFGERPRGARFAQMLEATRFGPVRIDEVGNVIGRRAGREGGRTVAVVAHLDTVFPDGTDVTVKIEGNRYTAPGVGDNTRGLVLLLELARAIVAGGVETDADVLLIGNVGEEGLGDLRGVRHLFRDGAPRIDAMIAIDGGQAGRLIHGAVGSQRYRVTFKGPGGHSWGAFGLANPHHALGRGITAFVQRAAPITATGEKSSFSVGRIGGGTSVNSIPFESWMEVDMRSGDPERLALLGTAFEAAMREALAQENAARARGAELALSIESVGRRPAGLVEPGSPLVQEAIAAMVAYGIEPILSISSTDANIPISLGVPAITLSRGGKTRRTHSLDESWEDSDTHLSTQIVLLTLLAQSGLREE